MTRVVRPNLDPPPPPINRWPTEYAIGTVLCFAKTFATDGKLYGYVTLRAADGIWYLTQALAKVTSPMTWPQLTKFIGDSPASICSEWTTIPQTGSGDLGDRSPYAPDPGVTMAQPIYRRNWPFDDTAWVE